jgi:predicted nucleic acid-binding Zn ribbon protein
MLASGLCTTSIRPGQEVCSGRWRTARGGRQKVEARQERDAEIRALLETALNKVGEDP